jgi:hypothetical protein
VEHQEVSVEWHLEVALWTTISRDRSRDVEWAVPKVKRCGVIPGKFSEKPVPSVAKVAKAPLLVSDRARV